MLVSRDAIQACTGAAALVVYGEASDHAHTAEHEQLCTTELTDANTIVFSTRTLHLPLGAGRRALQQVAGVASGRAVQLKQLTQLFPREAALFGLAACAPAGPLHCIRELALLQLPLIDLLVDGSCTHILAKSYDTRCLALLQWRSAVKLTHGDRG